MSQTVKSMLCFFVRMFPLVLALDLGHAQTRELILPVIANGYVKEPIHFQTTIRIVNLSSEAVEVTLEAYQNDGTPTRILELYPIPLPGTKTIFQIVPGGSVEAYTLGDDPTFHGWVRLEYDASASIQAGTEIALIDAPVGPHPICLRPSTEILTSAQVAGVQAAKKFAGFAVIRPYRKTAYGLANPCATQIANVFLSLLDISGQLIATARLQIPPQGMPQFPNTLRCSRWLEDSLVLQLNGRFSVPIRQARAIEVNYFIFTVCARSSAG